MPKTYFCKQYINGEACGESDPSKFIEGRYSTCRECRSRLQKKYTNKKIEEKVEQIDPKQQIRWLIEDTIKKSLLIRGKTIVDFIISNDEILSTSIVEAGELKDKISYMELVIRQLQKEIVSLKTLQNVS